MSIGSIETTGTRPVDCAAMLDRLNAKAKLKKRAYKEAMDALDVRLGMLQRDAKEAGVPAVVVLEGWQTAGKGVVLNRILQPLDPRGFKVWNTHHATELEQMYPRLRRFWLRLPRSGFIAIFNNSWYRPLFDRVIDAKVEAPPDNYLDRIRTFERQLTDDGALVLKFFLHISREEQAARFAALEADPVYAWKVGSNERRQQKRYARYSDAVSLAVKESSTDAAPWIAIPSTDRRYATVQMAESIASALEAAVSTSPNASDVVSSTKQGDALAKVDLSASVADADYDEALPRLQRRLRKLQHRCYRQRRPVVIVYEGWDAAGKGGNIRRMVRELDPRGYEVHGITAPSGEEKRQHYLWRFWRRLPKAGHFAIFDRSWYGRVLVERVEGFANEAAWSRAYEEINEFERELVDDGAVVCKFWIHISSEEQLARFEERQTTAHKRWKITEEDWRNREKWDAYYAAASDMIARTSTTEAPWTVVAGNDKRHARLTALRTVTTRVADALKKKGD